MDELIKRWDYTEDDDLRITARGVAYQHTPERVQYGEDYFNLCLSYEDQEIAKAINAGRIDLVNRHLGDAMVLDVGIGSGEFVKKRSNTVGTDINPTAREWLTRNGLLVDNFGQADLKGYTFWDVIEHVELPSNYFRAIPVGSLAFFSIPVFDDLKKIRESRHYRPGEHLYYWTKDGFINWMGLHGFELLETADYETRAGRDSIVSFAFRKGGSQYHSLLAQYQELHSSRYYGASASKLYLDLVAATIIKLQPRSILDYGCGRSDLAPYFWKDGKRVIARYDPAIPDFAAMPPGKFDLVLCTDVMEHIAMIDIDRVFEEIKQKSGQVLFVISLKLARAKLPDGRNAHVTILTKSEWINWIKSTFGRANEMPTPWGHVLMLKTF